MKKETIGTLFIPVAQPTECISGEELVVHLT